MAIINGDDTGNFLFGTVGDDSYFGFGGFDLLFGSFGNDLLDGGADSAVALYDDGSFVNGVTINNTGFMRDGVAPFTVDKRGFGTDSLVDVRAFHGTRINDVIYVNISPLGTYIFDREGDDFIQGFGSADNIFVLSSPGNDTIVGGDDRYDTLFFAEAATDPYYDTSPDGKGTGGVTVTFTGTNTATVIDPWGDVDQTISIEEFEGTDQADAMFGLDGNEWFLGRGGDDELRAGAGDRDTLEGGQGNDTLDGGNGENDRVYYDDDPAGVTANLTTGSATDGWGDTDTLIGVERLRGSDFDDTLIGDDGRNSLQGRGGADLLEGRGGADYLEGGQGNDTLDGGAGDADAASYEDDPGAVTVDLAAGTATDGWGDTDTLISIDEAVGSNFDDTIIGDDEDNHIEGRAGDDALSGGAGRDTFLPGEGNDTVDGGESFVEFEGGDRVRYDRDADQGGAAGVTVDLNTGIAIDGFGNTDTLISIEEVTGTDFDDVIVGSDAEEILEGRGGNDSLVGGDGGDFLDGGSGNDTLIGNVGQDFFRPGSGADVIEGGENGVLGGEDHLQYGDADNPAQGIIVTFTNATDGAVLDYSGATDVFTGIEIVEGSKTNDTFIGAEGNQEFRGLAGDDFFDGGAGDQDQLNYRWGGNTDDHMAVTVDMVAGTATDQWGDTDTFVNIERVEGTKFGDTITGNAERNSIRGREGDDLIDSFGGEDNFLDGDEGNDTIHARGDSDGVRGGDGDDVITFYGVGGNVNPGLGSDIITGGSDGFFSLQYDGVGLDVTIDVELGTTSFAGSSDVDTFTNIVNVEGGDGNDTLLGNDGVRQEFFSSLGDDFIDGRGDGDDGDRDWLIYDWGWNDEFADADRATEVNFSTGTATGGLAGTDTFVNIEAVRGSRADDHFIGSDQAYEEFQGMDGVDTIEGGGGQDRISYSFDDNRGGTQGVVVDLAAQTAIDAFGNADVISGIEQVSGSAFSDILLGSDDDNTLIDGGGGNDTMDGRGGEDFLWMGVDAVTATGGSGADEFGGFIEYFDGSTITDFSAEDRINVFSRNGFEELPADVTIIGNEMRIDVDGDGAADATVFLTNGYQGQVNVVGGPLGEPMPTVFSLADPGLFTAIVDEDAGVANVTITRSGDLTSTATVVLGLAGAGLMPVEASDVTVPFDANTTLTFAPGVEQLIYQIGITDDMDVEGVEDLQVTLSDATSDGLGGAVIEGDTTFVRIIDNDVAPSVRIDGQRRNEDGGEIEFIISRTGDLSDAITVPYLITSAGGLQGAEADDLVDGLPQSGNVTLAAGDASSTLVIRVAPDTVAELHDDIIATISAGPDWPAALTIGASQATGSIRNDDGVPPTLPTGATASNFGDPHLVTLDGLAYDFQAVGEFTLIEAASGDPLEVQVRFRPVDGSEVASQTTATATTMGGARVVVDVEASSLVTVDGVAFDLNSAVGGTGVGDGDIYYDGEAITLVYANGEQLRVEVFDSFMSTTISIGSGRDVRGLLGNGDGDASNDLALRDGTAFAQPVAFDVLYGAYADEWRISDATSLFDYATGQGTADFTDPSFPAAGLRLEDFPLEVVAAAQAATADIADPVLKEAAMLDYLISGNAEFIEAAARIEETTPVTGETAAIDAPRISSGIGVSASATEVVEGDDGVAPLTFTIYRTGDLSQAISASYEIGGDIDALDISGAIGGSVSFAAGQASAQVQIDVAGDTEVEENETLSFSISVSAEGPLPTLLSSIANVEILNDDIPIPEPELNLVEGTNGRDRLVGTDADDLIISKAGFYDRQTGGEGADTFVFGAETGNGRRERDLITDFEVGVDSILLTEGAEIAAIRETSSSTVIFFEGDRDALYIRGDGVSAETITILYDDNVL